MDGYRRMSHRIGECCIFGQKGGKKMSWTDEIPNDVGSVVEILKKHGCYWDVVSEILICIYCAVMFVVNDWDVYHLVMALGSILILAKTIELAFVKERVEKVEGTVADLADELIVKEHELHRLTLELDTAQASLKEAKKQRPASKRKFKTKTNENQD